MVQMTFQATLLIQSEEFMSCNHLLTERRESLLVWIWDYGYCSDHLR